MTYDLIVIGAGFSGSTFARCAAEAGKKVLILEQRGHIGGNCYDYRDEHGIIIHPYGPHLFHTDNQEVIDFLSRFSTWTPYHHRVQVHIDDKTLPLPINFDAIDALFDNSAELKSLLLKTFSSQKKVSIFELLESQNSEIKAFGEYVYDKVFVNYTIKQWGTTAEQIDPNVLKRVPIRLSVEDGYFDDSFQQMPQSGFTALFEKMLKHDNITLELNTDAFERLHVNSDTFSFSFDRKPFLGDVVYTGMLDAFFEYRYEELAYRSLRFDFQTLDQEYFQEVTTVNYPNVADMTRITEFKHMYQTRSSHTVIAKEYPLAYDKSANLPYYPLFRASSKASYERYSALAQNFTNLIVIGRLAEYKYYDMDDAVANALKRFKISYNNSSKGES